MQGTNKDVLSTTSSDSEDPKIAAYVNYGNKLGANPVFTKDKAELRSVIATTVRFFSASFYCAASRWHIQVLS